MDKISVLLVDDHDIVRTGVKRMLELEHDISVVGEASSAVEALSVLEEITPSLVLLDIKMPGMDGITLTREIKMKYPALDVVIFTLHEDYLNQALDAGASGYLLKDIRRDELTESIRSVLDGHTVISKSIPEVPE